MSNIQHEPSLFSMTDLHTVFTHFSPQEIEEFYQLYQLWSLTQRREEVVAHLQEVTQQIAENEARLKAVSPSTIAQATLSQFRASGVEDIDLLERMLDRGDAWLDHTLQLFERCERLDMIQGNATDWCEHALEGAYDWLESMSDTNEKNDSSDNTDNTDDDAIAFIPAISTDQQLSEPEIESLPETTEEDFLQKLMSEDGELSGPSGQPEENAVSEVLDEQQMATEPATEIEVVPSMSVSTVDTENTVESGIQANIDVDDPFTQEKSPIDEVPLAEETQTEPHGEPADLVEQEEYFADYGLTPVSKHEETEYVISETGAAPEILEDSEPGELGLYDQTENSTPTEHESIAESVMHLEDPTPAPQTEEIIDEPNTRADADIASLEVVDEPDTRADADIASLEVVDEPDTRADFDISPLEVGDELYEEKAFEQQDDTQLSTEEDTQQIRAITSRSMTEEEIQQVKAIDSRSMAEEETQQIQAVDYRSIDEEQIEYNKQAEYVREVALAEAASELENNTPAGLSAPVIEDISLPASPVVATPVEASTSDTQHHPEAEIQSLQLQPGKQNKAKKGKKKKPPKRGGFLQFLLAKLLHRR